MPLHDYRCTECGTIYDDRREVPECCSRKCEIFYGYWEDLLVGDNGNNIGEKTYKNGTLRHFGALDDPLTTAELRAKHKDRGNCKLSEDAREYFRGKLKTDGDSPKLREEILEARNGKGKASAKEKAKSSSDVLI